ncbi:MAG: tyrosine-type recombinase/integrase [Alphaproteobacteria bacterium]
MIEFVHNGVRFKKSSRTRSKRKAQELERQWRSQLFDHAVLGKTASMTLDEALDRYWSTVILPKGRKRSAQNTLYILRRVREDFGPDTPLEDLDTAKLTDWSDKLLQQGLAPSTVNRNLNCMKAVLNKAHKDWRTLAVVPRVSKKPARKETTRYLTEAEEGRLLRASPPYLQDLLVFMLGTGARLREATHLIWREVALPVKGVAMARFVDTKGGDPRGVPLPDHVRDLLVRLQERAPHGEERVFLFQKRDGSRVPYDNPKKAFTAARERAGLGDVRLHDLRHTYASRLVQRGVSLYEVQRLLGHSTPSQTQRYASLAPDNLQRAVKVLDAGRA